MPQEYQNQEPKQGIWDALILAGQLGSSDAGSFGQRTDLVTFFLGMGGVPLSCHSFSKTVNSVRTVKPRVWHCSISKINSGVKIWCGQVRGEAWSPTGSKFLQLFVIGPHQTFVRPGQSWFSSDWSFGNWGTVNSENIRWLCPSINHNQMSALFFGGASEFVLRRKLHLR